MRFAVLASTTLVLAAFAWGCNEESAAPVESGPGNAATTPVATGPDALGGEIVVVRDNEDLPPDCDPASVAELVGEFATALNEGDFERTQELAAPATGGPAMTPVVNEDGEYAFLAFTDSLEASGGSAMLYNTFDPAAMDDQLPARHDEHDTLRLVGVRVLGDGTAPNAVSGSFAFERTADDFAEYGYDAPVVAFGKYGINCKTQTVYLWVLTVDAEGGAPTLVPCPKPKGWEFNDASVLACS